MNVNVLDVSVKNGALQDLQAQEVARVPKVTRVMLDQWDPRVSLVLRENRVFRVFKEFQAPKDLRETKVAVVNAVDAGVQVNVCAMETDQDQDPDLDVDIDVDIDQEVALALALAPVQAVAPTPTPAAVRITAQVVALAQTRVVTIAVVIK